MRKILTILCSVMLAVALLAAGMTVSAAEYGLKNYNGTAADGVYRLTQQYSTTTMEHWSFYWYNGTSQYTALSYHEDVQRWDGSSFGATTAIIGGGGMSWHPHISGFTVAKFTCPDSGTVRIGTETALQLSNMVSDGVSFTMMSLGQLLGKQVLIDSKDPSEQVEVVTLDVFEGQEIFFYLGQGGNNAGDSTTVAPFVEYTAYKDVPKVDWEPGKVTTTEATLRTDLVPDEVDATKPTEPKGFTVEPLKIVIGAAPVVLIGVVILILVLVRKGRKNDGA